MSRLPRFSSHLFTREPDNDDHVQRHAEALSGALQQWSGNDSGRPTADRPAEEQGSGESREKPRREYQQATPTATGSPSGRSFRGHAQGERMFGVYLYMYLYTQDKLKCKFKKKSFPGFRVEFFNKIAAKMKGFIDFFYFYIFFF